MDLFWQLWEACKGFGEALRVSLFGEVTLNPPALETGEINLGGLNSFELFLLNYKRNLAALDLLVEAAIVSEFALFLIRLRLPLPGNEKVISFGIRLKNGQIVIALIDAEVESLAILAGAVLLTTQFLRERQSGSNFKKKIIKVDDYQNLGAGYGGDFFAPTCSFENQLWCNTCPWGFECRYILTRT